MSSTLAPIQGLESPLYGHLTDVGSSAFHFNEIEGSMYFVWRLNEKLVGSHRDTEKLVESLTGIEDWLEVRQIPGDWWRIEQTLRVGQAFRNWLRVRYWEAGEELNRHQWAGGNSFEGWEADGELVWCWEADEESDECCYHSLASDVTKSQMPVHAGRSLIDWCTILCQ